ncbi:MAG TPA: enoyl-CoA hydratase-related protein [Mycobacterium sp.]|nr:enoyl-CoA hydratase-related protein [Mycobacterium sp.]
MRSDDSTPSSTSGWRAADDRIRAFDLRAAWTGHDHHDQPTGAHERHWAADTSGAGRRLGPLPRRRHRTRRHLTGAGDTAFCAGGDLKAAFAGELDLDASPDDGVLGPSRWTDIYKPTIAAVNGVAYAGGLEWACWTDMAIADQHATFGVTCRRWNIGLADGGTQRLTRILGHRRAIELIVTGRVIDANEAERIGLVNEVVPTGTCVQRAIELAETIAALPQPAMRTDLEAARTGLGRPLDDGLRIEAQCFNRSIAEPDTVEGLRRFNERDHPDRRADTTPVTPGLARSL